MKLTLPMVLIVSILLVQYLYINRELDKSTIILSPQPIQQRTTTLNADSFTLYLRATTTGVLLENMEKWLLKSMKIFFLKKNLNLLLVLDNEKPEDHVYGNKFSQLHPEINVQVCYMDPYADNVDYGWGKARQYLDMMHADVCIATEEYVGFVDVDTIFVTAVTDDLLFENNKPIVIARCGSPQYSCWIQTAENILQVKQVLQCMSNFPITFKVSHIVEMRLYVERIHNKSFTHVFKEAPPKGCPTRDTGSWCHFSVMCNYMWYFHRDEYAWHLQLVPDSSWDGKNTIPALVQPEYFQKVVKENEKVPAPRPSVHAKYLFYKERFYFDLHPPAVRTNFFLREGLCHSFGFDLCPEKCSNFSQWSVQEGLFRFEQFNWLWDKRCNSTQQKHYDIVREIRNRSPRSFLIDLSNKNATCSILEDLPIEK